MFLITMLGADIKCNTSRKKFIVKSYYSNGNLKEEQVYSSDSIKDGYHKVYYINGNLALENHLFRGQLNGIEIGYYESGRIKYIGHNKLGKADSSYIYFYNDKRPKTSAIFNYFKGKLFGEQLIYYYNGKVAEYMFRNLNGELIYRSKYDSITGLRIAEFGRPLYVAYNRNKFSKGDSIKVISYIGVPPFCKYNFSMLLTKNNQRKALCDYSTLKGSFGYSLYYAERCMAVGTSILYIKLNLNDTVKGSLSTFSDSISILVMDNNR